MIGTETLMARHYQEAAIAAAAGGFGKDWPNTLKADIEASCEPVHRSSADGAIAMNRIVVTHERRMVVSGEGGQEESQTTLGQEQQRREEEEAEAERKKQERLREGSVNDDGYVSETTTTTTTTMTATRDGSAGGAVGGARFVQRQGSTDQMVQREDEDDRDVDLERGERRRWSHRR